MQTDRGVRLVPRLALALLALLLGSAALPLAAADGGARDARWIVRGHGVWVSPTGDEVEESRPIPEDRSTLSVSDGAGFGLGLEYRWTPRLGVELGAMTADLDADFLLETGGVVLTDTETIATTSYSLGLNLHFAPGRRADVYVGGFVAMTAFDDAIFLTEAGLREKRAWDDDYGFGAALGLDVPFRPGGAWTFSASARYLLTILEAEDSTSGDLDLDPLIVTAGVGYRF
jgi:outer membrane protein